MLSGGEKARLAFAKFMMTPGTLLILDEPTNHLDIPMKEMLEEALLQFQGSVIAVSHDRYFLRQIATRIVTVRLFNPVYPHLVMQCATYTSGSACFSLVNIEVGQPPRINDETQHPRMRIAV